MELRRDETQAGYLVTDYLSALAAEIQREVPAEARPAEPHTFRLFRMYAVLALAKASAVTVEDVHHAWVAWMADLESDHPAMKPFGSLRPEEQRQDKPFLAAIQVVVSRWSVEV